MQTPFKQHLSYLKCSKDGLHSNENLNMVCLQTSCLENSICCCACVETEHKTHKTRPLKMVAHDVRAKSGSQPHRKINIDIMLDIVKQHMRTSFQVFGKYKRDILTNLQNIEQVLQGYYNHTIDQILLKNSDGNILAEQALERAASPKNLQELKITIKRLIAMSSQSDNKGRDLSEQQLKQSLAEASESIKRSIQVSMDEVNSNLSKYHASIASLINSTNIWQANYQFSQIFKHNEIKILNKTRVKAVASSSYKFSIMEPSVGKINHKTFSFKIIELHSNWLAIGFCHRNIIKAKNYSFTFGSTGHGAYMMSSNGGSWSHTQAEHNNSLKALKFVKGDIVHATINQQEHKITFQKNNSEEHYDLPFVPNELEQLSPCVLFYYVNDEVEYIGNAKK